MKITTTAPGHADLKISRGSYGRDYTIAKLIRRTTSGGTSNGWSFVLIGSATGANLTFPTRDAAAADALVARTNAYEPTEAYEITARGYEVVLAYGDTKGEAYRDAEETLDRRQGGVKNTLIRTRPAARLACGCLPYGRGCYSCRHEYYMSS